MLYPHFPQNYLSCFKFAIFLPTNFSEEPKKQLISSASLRLCGEMVFMDEGYICFLRV